MKQLLIALLVPPFLLYATPRHGGAATPPRAVGADASLAAAQAPRGLLAADPSPTEQKRRVPKPEAGEKQREGDKQKDSDDSGSKDDNECWSSCLVDLLFHGAEAVAEQSHPAPPTLAPRSTAPTLLEWVAGSLGVVLPADSLAIEIPVWSGPGGERAGRTPVGRLLAGTDVRIEDVRPLPEGRWLMVATGDSSGVQGWVRAEDVVMREAEPAAAVPPLPERPASASARLPGFVLLLSGGAFGTGPQELLDEYHDGGWRVGAVGLWRHPSSLSVALDVGYSGARGYPQFNYESPTLVDLPRASRLRLLSIGLCVGQYTTFGSPNRRLFWNVGPTLTRVRESADIHFLTVEDSVVTGSGDREEWLSRWRVGGEAAAGFSITLGSSLTLGVLARGFVVSWSGAGSKSLTTDFIGRRSLAGFDAGIVLGLEP